MVNWDFDEPEFEPCDGCELCVVPCIDCNGYGYVDAGLCESCDGDGEVYDTSEHQIDSEDEEYERW
jgi:DnaJ-class molecular chaperone